MKRVYSVLFSSHKMNYNLYNFYFLPGGVEKISGIALADGTVDSDGFLNTHGAYTILNVYSNDITNIYYWVPTSNTIVLSANSVIMSAQYHALYTLIDTQDSVKYTLSFYAWVDEGDNTDNFYFYHWDSADGNITALPSLTTERKRYSCTVLGKSGGGIVSFGITDGNSSNWTKVYIDTINVTETVYAMPPAVTTIAALEVSASYADTSSGPKFDLSGMLDLIESLYGTDGTDAKGELVVEWMPMFDSDTAEDTNILSFNNTTSGVWYDTTNNLIKVTDGTNTASVACSIEIGTLYTIRWMFGDILGSEMMVAVNDTAGSLTTYAGSIAYDSDFSIGFQASNWQKIKSIKFFKNIDTSEIGGVLVSKWRDKDIIWVGTSLPEVGSDFYGTEESYPLLVGEILGATVTNESQGASMVTWQGEGIQTEHWYKSLSATVAEIQAHSLYTSSGEEDQSYEVKLIEATYDLIVFDHGYTDRAWLLGDIDLTTSKNLFYEAYNFVIAAILTDKPTAKFIFLTPPTEWTGGVNDGTIAYIRDAILALAVKYNVSSIDMTTLCGFTEANHASYFPDGIHPNGAARIRIAEVIAPLFLNA